MASTLVFKGISSFVLLLVVRRHLESIWCLNQKVFKCVFWPKHLCIQFKVFIIFLSHLLKSTAFLSSLAEILLHSFMNAAGTMPLGGVNWQWLKASLGGFRMHTTHTQCGRVIAHGTRRVVQQDFNHCVVSVFVQISHHHTKAGPAKNRFVTCDKLQNMPLFQKSARKVCS